MKKLAVVLAGALLLVSTPVFACPHSEDKPSEEAPKVVEKEKVKAPDKAKAKPVEKKKDTAKDTKKDDKKPEKVSLK